MGKIGKKIEEFRKLSHQPSQELSIIFAISIIIFGVGSLVYSEKRIGKENFFITILVLGAIIHLVVLMKNYKKAKQTHLK